MQFATGFIVVLISLEIICRSQGHIHANPLKSEGKVLFQVCHIIKIPLNGLTYNPAEHFTRFSHQIRSKLVKYSAGLYVNPFNKIYLLYIGVVLCVVMVSCMQINMTIMQSADN